MLIANGCGHHWIATGFMGIIEGRLRRFFFSSRRRHTSLVSDWSSDVCSSDLEHVVLLTVEVPDEPFLAPDHRATIIHLGKGVHRVVLRYGFMEQPDVPRDLAALADKDRKSVV